LAQHAEDSTGEPKFPSHEDLEFEDDVRIRALEEAQREREDAEAAERLKAEWELEEHNYEKPTTGFEYDYLQHAEPKPPAPLTPDIASAHPTGKQTRTKAISDVKAEPVPWLWPKRIAFGTLCIIDGDPGCGKTSIMLDLMARLSTGTAMPFEAEGLRPANSLIVSAEDSISNTIAPRVHAAHADASRVFVALEPLSFPNDVGKLKDMILERRARLVLVDPVLAMLDDGIDSGQDAKMRKVLSPLAALAAHTESAIVLVRHLNKALHSKTMYRGGSSIAIAAAARTCLLAAGAKGKMHLANYKSNLDVKAPTLVYELVDDGKGVVTVVWKDVSGASADEVMDASLPPGYRSQQEERAERKQSRLGEQLLAAIRKNPGMTKQEIRELKLGSHGRVDKALNELVEGQFLKLNEEKKADGGRPKRTYEAPPEPPQPQEDWDEEFS